MIRKKNNMGAYWNDSQWANAHLEEISREYPNQWVAIVGRKVVAAGLNLDTVISEAEEKTGHKEFPIYFAEGKLRVYQNSVGICSRY